MLRSRSRPSRRSSRCVPQTREVILHLAESGGKRVRPMLSLLSAQFFSKDPRPAVPVGIASEMIHMATLVHDDVIDRAETRRGRKTVNQIWGNHVSVLAGDALLAKALVILVDETSSEVVRIMSDMIYRMCEGEIAQHATLHDMYQDDDDYFDRIEKKTALFLPPAAKQVPSWAAQSPSRPTRCGRTADTLAWPSKSSTTSST